MCDDCADLFGNITPMWEVRPGLHPETGEPDSWLVIRGVDQVVVEAFGPDEQAEAVNAMFRRTFEDSRVPPMLANSPRRHEAMSKLR